MRSDKACLGKVDENNFCEHCGVVLEVTSPALWVRKAKFQQGGVGLRISMFGTLAAEVLGISATEAMQLEERAVKQRDSNRECHRAAIVPRVGKVFDISVDLKRIDVDDSPHYVSCTAYRVAPAVAVKRPRLD